MSNQEYTAPTTFLVDGHMCPANPIDETSKYKHYSNYLKPWPLPDRRSFYWSMTNLFCSALGGDSRQTFTTWSIRETKGKMLQKKVMFSSVGHFFFFYKSENEACARAVSWTVLVIDELVIALHNWLTNCLFFSSVWNDAANNPLWKMLGLLKSECNIMSVFLKCRKGCCWHQKNLWGCSMP